MEAVNIPLTQPIKAHGKDLDGITLRPLIAGDLRRQGFPFLMRGQGATVTEQMDAPVLSGLIGDLAGIPTSSVDQMQPRDWMEAVNVIRSFLLGSNPDGSSPQPGGSSGSTAAPQA